MEAAGGYSLAFLTAAGAVMRDYHVALSKALLHIPSSAYRHWPICVLCGVCGILAAILFGITSAAGDDPISAALRIHIAAAPLRGVAVGAMFLVLIRLRLFDTGRAGFGLDWLYVWLRDLVLQSFVDLRARARVRFLNENFQAAFAAGSYFKDVESLVRSSISSRPAPYRQRVSKQMNAAMAKVPAGVADANDPAWETFYRSLTGICYDACGPHILRDIPGIRF